MCKSHPFVITKYSPKTIAPIKLTYCRLCTFDYVSAVTSNKISFEHDSYSDQCRDRLHQGHIVFWAIV